MNNKIKDVLQEWCCAADAACMFHGFIGIEKTKLAVIGRNPWWSTHSGLKSDSVHISGGKLYYKLSASSLLLFCDNASLPCLSSSCLHRKVACWEARSMAAVLFLKSRELLSSGERSKPFCFSGMIPHQFFL